MIEAKSKGPVVPSSSDNKSARSERSFAPAALALSATLSLGLSACSSIGGTTYGTGESQEAALVRDVTSVMGVIPQEKDAPIDYSARAGLVLPPEGSALPSPDAGNRNPAKIANNWPQDPDVLRKAYQEHLATMTDEEREQLLAAIRKLPPEQRDSIIKNDPRSVNFANQIKEPDLNEGDANARIAYEKQVEERKALIRLQNGEGAKGRQYLTQPPERFTEVTPEVQKEMASIEPGKQDKKKKGLMGVLWPF